MTELDEELKGRLDSLALEIRDSKYMEQKGQDGYSEGKTQLWELIDAHVEEAGLLAHKDVFLKEFDEDSAREYAQIQFPEYDIESIDVNDRGATVFLKESPSYRGFEYYSEEAEVKIGRSVSPGKETFDIERFVVEQEELAEKTVTITTLTVQKPSGEPVKTVSFQLDQDSVEALVAEDPAAKIILAQYVTPGVPQAKMLPIARRKKAKK